MTFVWKLDRLVRSTRNLLETMESIREALEAAREDRKRSYDGIPRSRPVSVHQH